MWMEETIFIDGTKIEANANKYTFVWRKSIKRYTAGTLKSMNVSPVKDAHSKRTVPPPKATGRSIIIRFTRNSKRKKRSN